MASRKVRFRQAAIADLERLTTYITESSGLPATAEAYAKRIEQRCRELSDFPFIGRDHSNIRAGLRVLPFESVAIAFEVTDTFVRIRRIFGQVQDYQRSLKHLGR
jgi:toxin ParE1/3/4